MSRHRILLLALFGVSAATTVAGASEHGRHADGRPARSVVADGAGAPGRALYQKECGSCHVAFPPGLLRADSHRRVMAGLDRHFGQNAEVDAATRERLESWLVAHAAESGSDRRSRRVLSSSVAGEAPLRLTEASWFQRKHRKIGPQILARPSIGTFANCGACHAEAATWEFDDDRVTIPAR